MKSKISRRPIQVSAQPNPTNQKLKIFDQTWYHPTHVWTQPMCMSADINMGWVHTWVGLGRVGSSRTFLVFGWLDWVGWRLEYMILCCRYFASQEAQCAAWRQQCTRSATCSKKHWRTWRVRRWRSCVCGWRATGDEVAGCLRGETPAVSWWRCASPVPAPQQPPAPASVPDTGHTTATASTPLLCVVTTTIRFRFDWSSTAYQRSLSAHWRNICRNFWTLMSHVAMHLRCGRIFSDQFVTHYCWVRRWMNFEIRSTFAEVMGKNTVSWFWLTGNCNYFRLLFKAVVTTTIRLQFDRATTIRRPTLRPGRCTAA